MRKVITKGGKPVNIVVVPDGWTGKPGEWQPPPGHQVRNFTGQKIERVRPAFVPSIAQLYQVLLAKGVVSEADFT